MWQNQKPSSVLEEQMLDYVTLSLQRAWQIVKKEKSSLWTAIYAYAMGQSILNFLTVSCLHIVNELQLKNIIITIFRRCVWVDLQTRSLIIFLSENQSRHFL